MKRIFSFFWIFSLCLSMLLLNHCERKQDNLINIGAILPLTGNLAFLGIPEQHALEVAVNEINEKEGKIVVKLILEDSKGQAKDAVTAAQKLINVDKVKLGLVSTSSASNAVAPVFQNNLIPLITICSDSKIPVNYDQAVNIYVNIEREQHVMASYLLSRNISRISVIRVNAQITEEGVNLLKEYSDNKIKILNNLSYELSRADFKDIAAKIRDDASEAIYIIGYGIKFSTIIKNLRELNVEKPIFGNYMFTSNAAKKDGLEIYKGIYFTSFTITPNEIMNTNFGRRFSKLLGEPPGTFMDYVYVYEAIKIWYELINEKDDSFIFPKIIRGRKFQTLFGEMTIDKNGNAFAPMAIATYSDDNHIKIVWKNE